MDIKDIVPNTPTEQPTPQNETDTGETFLVDKPKFKEHPVKRGLEEAAEFTFGIPELIRKGQGVVHAVETGNPELARTESLEAAGTALLNVIPVEKILGPVGRGIARLLPEGMAGDAIQAIKNGSNKLFGPAGKFLNDYIWSPIGRVASKFLPKSPQEISPLEQLSAKSYKSYLQNSFNTLTKQAKDDLTPLMKGSDNIYPNRFTDPETRFKTLEPNKPDASIPMSIQPLKEIKEFGDVTKEEGTLNTFADGLIQGFRDLIDIKGSTGFASPEEAFNMTADKTKVIENDLDAWTANFMQAVDRVGKSKGIPELAQKALFLSEHPEDIVKELPEGLRYIPAIMRHIYDDVHTIVKKKGFEVPYLDNYLNRIIKWKPGTEPLSHGVPKDIRETFPSQLSPFVKHEKSRNLLYKTYILKDIADGKITSAEGLKNTHGDEMTEKDFKFLQGYLAGKEIETNPSKILGAHIEAWAKADLARSVFNMLHYQQVHPDIEWLRGAMTTPEYDAAKTMLSNAKAALHGLGVQVEKKGAKRALVSMRNFVENMPEGTNPAELGQTIYKLEAEMSRYVPGEKVGLPGGKMYSADAVRALKPLFQSGPKGFFMKNAMRALSFLKMSKLGFSMFHALNQTQGMMATGHGLDLLFVGKVAKSFENPEVYNNLIKFMTAGLNVPHNGKLIQDAFQMTSNTLEKDFGSKYINFLQNNRMSKYIFQVQLPADQYLIANLYKDKFRLSLLKAGKVVNEDNLNRTAAFGANMVMATLRPELMGEMTRNIGNYFLLARNWTYKNTYLVLNSLHEWFIKTPSALGLLPPSLGKLFEHSLNAIQTMEGLSPEGQVFIKKELADFMASALAQRMWRLQLMSYLISGHSTFQNEPGHQLDIDSGLAEIKRTPRGKSSLNKIYLNNLGFLHDAFNMPPITPPIASYQQTGNPYVFLNPMNYVDLGKTTRALYNKSNLFWHLAHDVTQTGKPGETPLEASSRILADTVGTAVPIPAEVIYQLWNQVSLRYGPDTAIEVLAMAIMGQPRIIKGSSAQTQKAYGKQAKKSDIQQIESGFGL